MRVLWLTLCIVVVDQASKVVVKLNMLPHESIPIIGDVFKLTFTENPGMAFGLSLGSKMFLSIFSVVATILIAGYLWHVRKGPKGYRVALALILGGALGNIIDRLFYGVIWDYNGFLYGNVVDFIHLDIWRGIVSESIPLIGGRYFAIFPIGNIADLAIIAGVVIIVLFQRRFHNEMNPKEVDTHVEMEEGELGEAVSAVDEVRLGEEDEV
ncbi:MAG: signal peptidase II [Rubricoccaceae bacterium]|nr:signal peptidase II [Rubricoccaceae bacterium]